MELGRYSIILVGLMFFSLIGAEVIFGSWSASYAVMNEYTSKENAPLYSSLYWGTMTVFRFIFPFVPGKPSKKLTSFFILAIVTCISSVLLIHFVSPNIGLIFCAVFLGMATSVNFPLTLTIPK